MLKKLFAKWKVALANYRHKRFVKMANNIIKDFGIYTVLNDIVSLPALPNFDPNIAVCYRLNPDTKKLENYVPGAGQFNFFDSLSEGDSVIIIGKVNVLIPAFSEAGTAIGSGVYLPPGTEKRTPQAHDVFDYDPDAPDKFYLQPLTGNIFIEIRNVPTNKGGKITIANTNGYTVTTNGTQAQQSYPNGLLILNYGFTDKLYVAALNAL